MKRKACHPETYKTRVERCVRHVKDKYDWPHNKRVNPWAVCKATIRKFSGKVSSCKPMPTRLANIRMASARRAK